jgi:hypothetical protein
MKICDECNIVFDLRDCPCCELKEIIENLEKEIQELNSDIKLLSEQQDD